MLVPIGTRAASPLVRLPLLGVRSLRADARSAYAHDFVNWSVSNHHLAVAALQHGLGKHLAPSDVHLGEKLLGTIMEALLGAIYEDCGRDSRVVRSAMTQMGLRVSPDEWKSRRDSVRNFWLDYKEKTRIVGYKEFWEEIQGEAQGETEGETQGETQGEIQKEPWKETRKETRKETSKKAWKEIQKQETRRKSPRTRRWRFPKELQRTISLEKREPVVASGFGSGDLEEQAAAGENFEDIVNSYYSLEDASSRASDGSSMESESSEHLTQDPVWRQHGWVSQHCQITLEVAQSKRAIRRRE
jgi:hypothetical protein